MGSRESLDFFNLRQAVIQSSKWKNFLLAVIIFLKIDHVLHLYFSAESVGPTHEFGKNIKIILVRTADPYSCICTIFL